jgi:starch phosphorylase
MNAAAEPLPSPADSSPMPNGRLNEPINFAAEFQESLRRHLRSTVPKELNALTVHDWFRIVSLAVRDRLVDLMRETEARYARADAKRIYYLSMEFLTGRSLGNNLVNLGIADLCREVLTEAGVVLDDVLESEHDAALGNGGLGRLAACFLDSLATLGMPGFGYGINYEFGLFQQEISDGYQREKPDYWLRESSPWLIERADEQCIVPIYGRIEHGYDRRGNYNPMWMDWKVLIGVPHDMPIVGYLGQTVNFLRLYSARASEQFDMQIFNSGDYVRAAEEKLQSETISKVLYPSDMALAGRELRLKQEYFFVACALRDIVRRYLQTHTGFAAFPDKVAIQLNDTHPALAVAELMRILHDENDLAWETAWEITQATVAYTNHTLLPEALERWPVGLMEVVLPRHLQIIQEINTRLLKQAASLWPDAPERLSRVSLIEEGHEPQVRMAHLAIAGSHSVNGVSVLHSELVRTKLVPDLYALWPERFNNKTNGVTQRRWLLKANPGLARLITETIGTRWVTDLECVRELEPHAADAVFQERFREVKRANKERLARVIKETTRVSVDPATLFDVQVKRIHEYKRQLLAAMGVMHEYLRLVEDGIEPRVPRTYVFAGKAAPGYAVAKQIIKLINNIGSVVNNDPRVRDLLKVVFVPDYRVSLAIKIIPAADLSEQISTAGMEASGTGNMKLAMNGALTIGTLDGANIEIRNVVGEENIFIFGLTAPEIEVLRREGGYGPLELYEGDPHLRRVIDALRNDVFSPDEPGLFQGLADLLLADEKYFLLADFAAYVATQGRVAEEFATPALWLRKAILNVARMGWFSSDRAIREYASEIWGVRSFTSE